MTFRRRIALLAGLSFVAAVLVCSLAGYLTVRREMLGAIERDLRSRVDDPAALGLPVANATSAGVPNERGGNRRGPRPRVTSPSGPSPSLPTDVLSQLVTPTGDVTTPAAQRVDLPVDDVDREMAGKPDGAMLVREVVISDEHYQMITASTGDNQAVQVARPLTEVEATLRSFALGLIGVSIAGAFAAAGVGWWVARRSAEPVLELTRAAERVAETLDLEPIGPVEVTGRHDDEIGRLARAMTEMLEALRRSREQQHRLVLDAGHELRTPLTSLRTNVSLLDHPDLDLETRAAIVADLRAELDELTNLSIELVELASDRQQEEQPTLVAIDELAERVAERARKRTGQHVTVTSEPWTFVGRAGQLDRAIQNLVDNATKWNPPSQCIEIMTTPGEIRVRDHGPGVADSERELIFDRFYRSAAARSTPGSGLGLAIVRQIVAGHGGTVHVERAANGGSVFVVRLPQ